MEQMLASMTTTQFNEWRVYDELEPFGEERMDWRIASVCQALWNIARDTVKHPRPWPVSDFLLAFGDTPMPEVVVVVQPLNHQERLIDTWVITHNLALEAKATK